MKVQNRARRLAPVDTGTLRRSITFKVTGVGGAAVARVGSNLEYALGIETGTGVYGPFNRPITPKKARALVFPSKVYGAPSGKYAGFVVVKSVKGRRATPYLEPALTAILSE